MTPKPIGERAIQEVGIRQHILLVEDDKSFAVALSRSLTSAGYDVRRVESGEAALYILGNEKFDQILLDIGLPGIDGLEVLRDIRAKGKRLPVILITARDTLQDRLAGLNLGADDYMAKPFAMSELIARVHALARRGSSPSQQRLVNGPLTMDLEAKRVFIDSESVEMPRREWMILKILLDHVEKIVTKKLIVESITRVDGEMPSNNAIDVHFSRLRAKLQPAGIIIRTVRGYGYMMLSHRDPNHPTTAN